MREVKALADNLALSGSGTCQGAARVGRLDNGDRIAAREMWDRAFAPDPMRQGHCPCIVPRCQRGRAEKERGVGIGYNTTARVRNIGSRVEKGRAAGIGYNTGELQGRASGVII